MTTVARVALSPGHTQDLISAFEWDCLRAGRHNVLLEGPDDSTDRLVRLLEPWLRRPLLWRPSAAPFARPSGECGALVLRNVWALGRSEQAEVLRWLDDPNERKQVVSTTARSLFPLVERGLFDERLYYRLNVILLRVDAGAAAPSAR